jgi:hypothetical protein
MNYRVKIALVVGVFILLMVLLFGETKGITVNGKNAKNIWQFFKLNLTSIT